MLGTYAKNMLSVMEDHMKENKVDDPFIKKYLVVDALRVSFLREFDRMIADNILDSTLFSIMDKAFKTGALFSIAERQNKTILGITNGTLYFHPDNTALITDMKKCVKAEKYSPERKTTSSTNYLDRIDSMEYGLQYAVLKGVL